MIEGLSPGSGACISHQAASPLQAKVKKTSYAHMIRRFLCLLLVPLILANQGLCFAHVHHGTDIVEPEGHVSRPHFHFGGRHDSTHDHDHHADHSHGDHSGRDPRSEERDAALPPSIAPIGDHDADAVYGAAAVTFARDRNSQIVPLTKHVAAVAILQGADQSDDWLLRLGPLRGQSPSVFDTACAIFLRTLSLRI